MDSHSSQGLRWKEPNSLPLQGVNPRRFASCCSKKDVCCLFATPARPIAGFIWDQWMPCAPSWTHTRNWMILARFRTWVLQTWAANHAICSALTALVCFAFSQQQAERRIYPKAQYSETDNENLAKTLGKQGRVFTHSRRAAERKVYGSLLGRWVHPLSPSTTHSPARQKFHLPAEEQLDFIEFPLQNIRFLQHFGESTIFRVLPLPILQAGRYHIAGSKPWSSTERNVGTETISIMSLGIPPNFAYQITKHETYFTSSKANSPTHHVLSLRVEQVLATCEKYLLWGMRHFEEYETFPGHQHIIMILFLLVGACPAIWCLPL